MGAFAIPLRHAYIWPHHGANLMPQQSGLSSFITELKRRRVFRVAAVYGGMAFVVVQIVDGAFDYLHIPEWFGTAIIVLVLVGFPFAVGLAWVFDITPEGIVRTDRPRADPGKRGRAQPLSGKPLTSNRVLIVIAVLAVAFGVRSRWSGNGGTAGQIRSIAVLPLVNLMNDPDQDYFVDGMHEALISNLSRIDALKVISRTSTLGYRNTRKRLPEIARELGVDAIVEGSVLRAGDRVRITAQLIHGRSDEHLWSANYERDLVDILALQNEVARRIAEALRVTLSPSESARLDRQPTQSIEAYNFYLKGYHFWNKRTGRDLRLAKNFFQQAINADPLYAQAYVGLADTYNLMDQYSNVSRDEAFPKAKGAALKALAIDPGLAKAHTSLAYVLQNYAWDFAEAEREYLIALELNPNYATGQQWYAELLAFLGRFDEAIPHINAAHELDPLSPIIAAVRSWIYYCDEQYVTARQQFESALDLHPGFPLATGLLTLQMLQTGQIEEWLDLLAEDHSRYGPTLKQAAELRLIWEQYGLEALILETGLASKVFNAEGSNLFAKSVARIIAQDAEGLLAQLEEGFEARLFSILFLAEADPGVRALMADDPKYRELLTRMGLD